MEGTVPIPVDKLENYRRTIVRRPNKNNEDFEEQFQSLSNKQQKRVLQGQAWTGETWFKLKPGTTVPTTTTATATATATTTATATAATTRTTATTTNTAPPEGDLRGIEPGTFSDMG